MRLKRSGESLSAVAPHESVSTAVRAVPLDDSAVSKVPALRVEYLDAAFQVAAN